MKLNNDFSSSTSLSAKTKPNENKRPLVIEEEGKALSKKTANTSGKQTKGLKRNLKNWEAFIIEEEDSEANEDDDDDRQEGSAFDFDVA